MKNLHRFKENTHGLFWSIMFVPEALLSTYTGRPLALMRPALLFLGLGRLVK